MANQKIGINETKKKVALHLNHETHKNFKKICAEKDITMSSFVEQKIEELLSKEERVSRSRNKKQ